MVLLKIKFDGKKIHMKYEKEVENLLEPDLLTLESADQPVPSFNEALQKMKLDLCEILELDDPYADTIEISGVTMSYSDGITGLTITGLKTLKNSDCPACLNTPHIKDHNGLGDKQFEECFEHLFDLFHEAESYLEGARAQISMFEKQEILN